MRGREIGERERHEHRAREPGLDPHAVERVPRSIAVKYKCVPIEIQDGILVLAVSDPSGALPAVEIAELARVSGVKTVLCTPESVTAAIDENYGTQNTKQGVSI